MATCAPKFKVESGIQLLARLSKRPDIRNFYPFLFQYGPKHNEVIDLFSDINNSFILIDMITEALIPSSLGGPEAGVLIFNTDGNMDFEDISSILQNKLLRRTETRSTSIAKDELKSLLTGALSHLYWLEIYDSMQFYTTIHNLENILSTQSDISLIIIDRLTAFYWSEQEFKILKMDLYVKNVLRMIQKVTKEYKISILYTRPLYFSSCKDSIENLEACCDKPTLERVNFRVHLISIGDNDNTFQVNIRTFDNLYKHKFILIDNEIKWL